MANTLKENKLMETYAHGVYNAKYYYIFGLYHCYKNITIISCQNKFNSPPEQCWRLNEESTHQTVLSTTTH